MSTLSYTEICNAPWMYIYVALLILACCLHSFIFARRAWKHGLEIGLTAKELRQPLTTGIAISVFPTIPVVITMIGLIPLLGAPLPWLRLSVIGGAAAEAMSANAGVEAVGEVLEVGGYTVGLLLHILCAFLRQQPSSLMLFSPSPSLNSTKVGKLLTHGFHWLLAPVVCWV